MSDADKWIELAKLSLASYASPINHKKMSFLGAAFTDQDIVHGSLGRGFCRVMWNDRSAVILFRGTRERIDWTISNFRCFPVSLRTQASDRPLVHRGFQQALYYTDKSNGMPALSSVLARLECLIDRAERVVVTGHSLGGAIATLFAVKLALERPDVRPRVEVVTFGAPAVGLTKFKSLVDRLGLPITRIVHANDGVPFTPPFFYRHVGRECWLSDHGLTIDAGWSRRLPLALAAPFSMSDDHSMLRYVVALYAHAGRPIPSSIVKRVKREEEMRLARVR